MAIDQEIDLKRIEKNGEEMAQHQKSKRTAICWLRDLPRPDPRKATQTNEPIQN
jgi:hypothetical protein